MDKYDRIILNLKIIAQIPRNGRLRRITKGAVTLEDDHLLVPLKRMIYHDSRHQSLNDLSAIINESISESKLWLVSKDLDDGEDLDSLDDMSDSKRAVVEKVSLMYRELERSTVGLENLKSTYRDDISIVSSLDILIEKVHSHLADIKRKCPMVEENLSSVLVKE